MLGMTMYAHLYMVKISNQGLRLKIVCLSDSEFTIFSNPRIRNLWGYTLTKTRTSSLPKKACQKGKLLLPLPAKGPLVGCNEEGVQGGHKRPLIWGVYAGNVVREHGGVCEANGFPADEDPYGALSRLGKMVLGPPPWNEGIL